VNPRELLQSAQAAEREGDLERAGALLEQAAHLYEETGHPARAAQMRRQAARLGVGTGRGERREASSPLDREVSDISSPDTSSLDRSSSAETGERAVPTGPRSAPAEPLGPAGDEVSNPSPGAGRTLIERAPALAEPGLEAWCSFCCRPSREVGRLVAGPAQAFICSACTELAASLLNGRSSA
jgi:hypothetical protein